VSVADIIVAVDEPIDATQCGGKENCHDDRKCITHDLWANLNQHIFDYLGAVTLKQLVDEQRAKQNGVAQVRDMRETLAKRERTPVSI
jgi:Rrf2 family iron-sulfur cluster assembly transcriptional regulator